MADPPKGISLNLSSKPNFLETSSRIFCVTFVISGPIPSPGNNVIL